MNAIVPAAAGSATAGGAPDLEGAGGRARGTWTDFDWNAARRLADAAWDAHRSNLYLYDAERALREQHYRRTAARLAAEARLDAGWLIGVIDPWTDTDERRT